MRASKFLYNTLFAVMVAAAAFLTVVNFYPVIPFYTAGGFDALLLGIVLFLTGSIFSSFISVLLHEAGHMLFSLFCGFKITSFKIFNRETIYMNGRITRKKIKNNFSYGSCELVNKKQENIEKRFFWVTLGGILLSFIVFAAYLLMNIFLKNSHPYIYTFICTGMLISLYIFLSALLPFEIRGTHTDGAILLGLAKSRDFAKVLTAILKIQAYLYEGRTPCQIDREVYFDVPLLSDDHVLMMQLYLMRYYYHLDANEREKAEQTSRRLLSFCDILPADDLTPIYLNIVFELTVSGKETEKAKATYKFIEERLGDDITTLRVKAYYYGKIEHDEEKALEYVDKALEKGEGEILDGLYKMENKLLKKLKETL